MKKILFLANLSLKNPKKGTPLRAYNVAKQLIKKNELIIYGPEAGEDLSKFFVPCEPNKILYFFKALKIIYKNKIDIIFVNTDINIIMPVLLKIFSMRKIVIDLHGLYAEELFYEGLINSRKRFFIDFVIKNFIRFYDLVLATSDNLKEYYKKYNKNIEVIYNGVDINNIYKKRTEDPSVFSIGYMGNLKNYQGFDHLLEAVSEIKKENIFNFKLILVLSSGAKQISALLKRFNLKENTILYIKLEHDKINQILNKSSVLVVPRLSVKMTEYAYPSKLPEYMATGIPTITTNVGPVNKLFRDHDNCVIIDKNNITKNLKKAIIKIYNMSQAEKDEMGEKAIKFIKNNLSWDVLGDKVNHYIKII